MPVVVTQTPPVTIDLPGVKVIWDTDFGEDADDIFDLAVMLQHMTDENLNVLAITSSNNTPQKCAGAIDTIVTHFGKNIAIGRRTGVSPTYAPADNYAGHLYDTYSHPHVGLADAQDSIDLTREKLAGAPDNSVWLIYVGRTHGANDLLTSVADGHSALNGADLMAQKCAGVLLVAGQPLFGQGTPGPHNGLVWNPTDSYWEFNASGTFDDSGISGEANMREFPGDSHDFIANFPVGLRLVMVPIHLGYQIQVGKAIASNLPANCPVRTAFEAYCTASSWTESDGRQAWSQPAFHYLLNPTEWFTLPGTISVNAGTGVCTFQSDPGGAHEILCRARDVPTLQAYWDSKLYAHGV